MLALPNRQLTETTRCSTTGPRDAGEAFAKRPDRSGSRVTSSQRRRVSVTSYGPRLQSDFRDKNI